MRRLLDVAEWLCGARATREVIEPLLADWQRELGDARGTGRGRYARALASGGLAYAGTLAKCLVIGGGWLPSSRTAGVGVFTFLIAMDASEAVLMLLALESGRPVDLGSIGTLGFMLSSAALLMAVSMLPAMYVLRRDPDSTTRHAIAGIALGAILTATVIGFTAPEALNSYFSSFESSERQYQRNLANDRAGRYQYPGTAVRQLTRQPTLEERRERYRRFEAWRAEQEAKRTPLTWQQRLGRYRPVVLGTLFGMMGWTLAGLGAASLARAALWWGLMYLVLLVFSGALSALFTIRLPGSLTLPTFSIVTLALVAASWRRHEPPAPAR